MIRNPVRWALRVIALAIVIGLSTYLYPAPASAADIVPAQLGQPAPRVDGNCQAYSGPQSTTIVADGAVAPLPTTHFTTRGNEIWDADHNVPFHLHSVNWYGAEEQNLVVDGLQEHSLSAIVGEIKAAGFNSIRLPFSNEMVELSALGYTVCDQAVASDPSLVGHSFTPLQVLGATIREITRQGLLVILDDHTTDANWSGAAGDENGLWYHGNFAVGNWESDWLTVIGAFGSIPGVVGVDLRNEPRMDNTGSSNAPVWDNSTDPNNWRLAASEAGSLILSHDPNLLVFVEGLNYAKDLTMAGGDPVTLVDPSTGADYSSQLVYEAHEYSNYHGSSGNPETADQMTNDFNQEWGYLLGEGHAVWIGEFGTCNYSNACFDSSAPNTGVGYNGFWFTQFTSYLRHHPELGWSYWPLNGVASPAGPFGPTGDSHTWGGPETYGVLNKTWDGLATAEQGSAVTDSRALVDALSGTAPAAENLPACTANTLPANDDGSTSSVPLPFGVNFYGKPYSALYVNNNGNVTFDAPLSTYTPFGLTATQTSIIAPFFADVDTRGPGSGLVTYGGAPASGGNPAYFCVNGFNVGYFAAHTDKTNSFQLLLIDRSAQTGIAGDFDIVFNYDRVQWETGDASGGSGGLGGTSVRVGYSNGSTRSAEVFGSGINGALLDGGLFALTSGSQGSTQLGRYVFPIRNGSSAGGNFEGMVTDNSNPPIPVNGATLQFCTSDGGSLVCSVTSTNALGHYSETGLPPGQYFVRVSPPAGSSLFESDLGPIALADQATVPLDVTLNGPRGLTPGTTITNLHTNPDGTPVLDWRTNNTLTTHGCVGGSASYTMTIANNQYGSPVSGSMSETPSGSGTYVATIPPTYPQYGPAQVVISITCPNPAQNQTITFDVYIDPSGSVVDQGGNPVSGATVTLFRADAASGPFTEVPANSSIMSPANRLNPDTTSATGRFGWDVLQGYYEIRASKAGCTAPGNQAQAYVQSPVEQIPPPAANLVLMLQCTQPTTSTLASSLNPSPYGQSVTLTDTVTAGSGSPSGSVTFYDGATSLGTATLGAGGKATLATSLLSVGNHSITAIYAASGSFLGSTSNTVVQVVTYTSCITGSRNGGLTVPSGQAICVTSTGRVNGTTTVQNGGLLYVNGGTLNGGVTVRSGGALFVNGGTINGGTTLTGSKAVSICGTHAHGGISVSGSTGFVLIGDGGDDGSPGCAGNTISGGVTLTGNAAGVELGGNVITGTVTLTSNSGTGPSPENAKPEIEVNHVNGSLGCTSNSPAPLNDGQPNSVSGSRTGQCSAPGL